MSRAWEYMPGIPAAGHVTSGGFWHPGRAEGCAKCQPSAHAVRVRHLPAFGQFRPECEPCRWVGSNTDAAEAAQAEADRHQRGPLR